MDFEESFAPVARLGGCQDLLSHMCTKVFSNLSTKVYTSRKALYGLKLSSPESLAKYTLEILKKLWYGKKDKALVHQWLRKPKLDADLSGEPVDQTDYRSKIGSLMYLTSSRPDIVQAVCYCARYQARPTENTSKSFFRCRSLPVAFDTRKSTSRRNSFLGDKLVSGCQRSRNALKCHQQRLKYVAFIC
ncbi:hypothetical protein Tco_1336901 [Tanacetum coccineum]